MRYKSIRAISSILIVCILIFNLCTTPVHASMASELLWVLGENVMAGIIRALNVKAGAATQDFSRVVSSAWAEFKNRNEWADMLQGNMMQLLVDPAKALAFVPVQSCLAVWDWLYNDSVFIDASTNFNSYGINGSASLQSALDYARNCPRAYVCYHPDGRIRVIVTSDSEYAFINDSGTLVIQGYGTAHSLWDSVYGTWGTKLSSTTYTYPYAEQLTTSPIITTSYDLNIDGLMPSNADIKDVYAEWASTISQRTGADGVTRDYIALGIGSTVEDTISKSEDEIWSGVTSVAIDSSQVGGVSWGDFKSWLSSLLSPLSSLVNIGDVIKGALSFAFVPAEGYLDTKLEMLISKHAFANSVKDTVSSLNGFFQCMGSTPPIIWIDLGASRGQLELGGRIKFVDLTWYAEYKPTVDVLLSAFLYLWFVWRIAHSLPGILNGTSGFWDRPSATVDLPLAPVVRTPIEGSKALVKTEDIK